jgi:hypothetical protein
MKRTMTTTLKSILLVGLAIVFCTKLPSTMDKLEQNIGATSLVAPADGSTDNILEPRLVWMAVAGATGYHVQVSTTSDFSKIVLDSGVTDTFVVVTGLAYKTIYYWRVQVHDATSSSDWTTHRAFTTIVEPQTPVVVLPKDNMTGQPTTLLLVWNSASGAASYYVQVASDTGFAAIVATDSTLADTSKVIHNLSYNNTYFWRVRSRNPGGASAWTTIRRFTTIIEPQTPTVVLPNDTAQGQPTSLKLIWNSAAGAASYFVMVASDTGFTAIVAVDSTLADTSKVVSNLLNSTVYYWRVKSKNPGGASAWTAMRSFTTIVAAPKVPGPSSPVSGATNQQLSLVLTWNKVPDASGYYLQVTTDIAFANIVIQDSVLTDTSKSIAGLANGVLYYWRVKAKNDGGTSAWSNLSGFTTFAAVPQRPVLSSPADGAADQTIPLTVSWTKATGAASYHLQMATDSGFVALGVVDSALADTLKSVGGLANNTKYFWRVRAKNPVGVSSWSTTRSFITFAAALQAPVLRSPADGATGQPVAPVLLWQGVNGAKKYHIQVSISSDFSTIVTQDSALTDTSRTLAGLDNSTTYFWRVRAENATGFSNWTTPWRFTTIMAAPQVPVPVSPADGATGQQLSPLLTWNKAAGAATYCLQVSADSNFASFAAVDSSLIDTVKQLGGLANSTTYFWKVSSKNAIGASGWSVRRSFTTFAATLQMPTLESPKDGAVDQPKVPVLSWSTVTNAINYQVQVSAEKDFSKLVVDDATLVDGSKTLVGLLNSTTYFWRVRAKSLSGTSNWTDPWSFTTIITTPGTPALVLPIDKAVDQPVSVVLTWNKATGSESYFLQIATDTGFSTGIVSSDSSLTDTVRSISGLSNSTTYYWKVKGKNASGYGFWSSYRTFSTIVAAPASPVLTAPLDSATNTNPNMQLSWNPVTGAVTYHIQVSTAPDFSTGLAVNDSTLAQATKPIGPLSNNTRYYWHARAANAGGASSWSERRSFTTIPLAPSVAPTPLAPVSYAVIVDLNPPLCWTRSSGATQYHLQVATTSSFSGGIVFFDDSTLTDTVKAIGPLASNVTYCWHVQAKNAGGSSDWSTTGNFITLAKPAAPVLRSPADTKMNVKLIQTLVWNVSMGATGYHLQAGTSNDFTSGIILDDSTLTDTTEIIGPLTPGISYFWRLQAKNAAGSSDWSSNFSFTTFSMPAVPALISPADNKTNEPLATTLSWAWATGANKYRVQVSSHQDFSNIDVKDSTLTQQTLDISGLSASTKYFWRAQSISLDTVGAWAAARNFTTVPALPAAPTLTWPVNDTTYSSKVTTLRWDSAARAVTYHVQLSTDSGFTASLVVDDSALAITQKITGPAPLSANTKYFWRVNAKNAGGTGPWSAKFSFTTYKIPAVPALVSPANDTTNQSITPTLSWSTVTDAVNYRFQVSTQSDFSSVDVKDGTQSATSYQLSGLVAKTKYFWRVRSVSPDTNSDWSTVRNFTTEPIVWKAVNSGLTNVNIYSLEVNGSYVFAGTGIGVFASNTNGASWSPVQNNLPALNIYALQGGSTGVNYAGTGGSGVYRTFNDGASWTAVNTGLTASDVQALNAWGSIIYAGTAGGGVFKTIDSGATWTAMNSGLTDNLIYSLAVSGAGDIFAGTSGSIFRSSDEGVTWTKVSSVSAHYSALMVNGSSVFAGSASNGVSLSTDNGATWTAVNSGILNMNVTSFAASGNNIFAGTGGGGVFMSSNNGTSWTTVNTGLTNSNVQTLLAIGSNFYAGTIGGGVFISPLP